MRDRVKRRRLAQTPTENDTAGQSLENHLLPVPCEPATCQLSMISTLAVGKIINQISGAPLLSRR